MALVTVERYGVLDSFVQPFDRSVEKIEIPVEDDFFPGIYVSVAAFSPRVDKPADGEVDLGKPAQWTGYVKIPVLDESRQIEVKVTPQKQDYRPGQTMTAQISAALPGKEKQPVEAAVIVVDEAVLSLLPKGAESFDPYLGLNRLGDLDVRTYSLVEQLIGRQKIEKKGANQGGDGGSDFAMRDVFKFVAYFNPSLLLDKNGRLPRRPVQNGRTGGKRIAGAQLIRQQRPNFQRLGYIDARLSHARKFFGRHGQNNNPPPGQIVWQFHVKRCAAVFIQQQ